jgi:integrase
MSEKKIETTPFDMIKGARLAIKQRNEDEKKQLGKRNNKAFSAPSFETIGGYKKLTKVLFKSSDPWMAAANTTKLSTWLKRKSAMLRIAKTQTIRALSIQDKMQRLGWSDIGHKNFDRWCKVVNILSFYSRILNTKPDPEKFKLKKVVNKVSKRKTGKLPVGWREMVSNDITKSWREQFLVQAVTGCRPVEIAKGIRVVIKDGQLVARIHGAKLGEFSGQYSRVLIYDIPNSTPVIAELIKLVEQNGSDMVIDFSKQLCNNPSAIYSIAVRDSQRRLWPKMKSTLTAYSIRHAAASDLKASGLSSEAQSQALGHQSAETKSVYGSFMQGGKGGSVAPKSVGATTKVRSKPVKSAPPIKKTKPK